MARGGSDERGKRSTRSLETFDRNGFQGRGCAGVGREVTVDGWCRPLLGLGSGSLQGGCSEVGEAGASIIMDVNCEGFGQLATLLLLGVDDAVIKDVGQRGPEHRG